MVRRLFALALWCYFAWYLVALIATQLDLPAVLGPAAAVAMAAIALVDWRRLRHAPSAKVEVAS